MLQSLRIKLLFIFLVKIISYNENDILLTSTMDGTFSAIRVFDGKLLWNFNNKPVLEQSISDIEIRKDNSVHKLIPDLNGNIFLSSRDVENALTLKNLPFNIKQLFYSQVQLNDGTFLTGYEDVNLYAVRINDGSVLYKCTKLGCNQFHTIVEISQTDAFILIQESHNKISEVNLESGEVLWHYSVRLEDIKLLRKIQKNGKIIHFPDSKSTDDISQEYNLKFSIKEGSVKTYSSNKSKRLLWSQKLNSPLVKSWIFKQKTRQIQLLDIFELDNDSGEGLVTIPGITSHIVAEDDDEALKARPDIAFVGSFLDQSYILMNRDIKPGQLVSIRKDPNRDFSPVDAHIPERKIIPFQEDRKCYTSHCRSNYPEIEFVNPAQYNHYSLPDYLTDDSSYEWLLDSANDFIALLSGEGFFWGSTSAYNRIEFSPVKVRYSSLSWLPIIFSLFAGIWVITRILHLTSEERFTQADLDGQRSDMTLVQVDEMPSQQELVVRDIEEGKPQASSMMMAEKAREVSESPPVVGFQSIYETEFKYEKTLGRGGFGKVFEVVNRIDGCRYAIKRIKMPNSKEEKFRFMREVKVLASIDHQGIVRYFRAWIEIPPDNWQEERDRVVIGDSLNDDDFTESFNSEKSSAVQKSKRFHRNKSHLLMSNQDSFDIFHKQFSKENFPKSQLADEDDEDGFDLSAGTISSNQERDKQILKSRFYRGSDSSSESSGSSSVVADPNPSLVNKNNSNSFQLVFSCSGRVAKRDQSDLSTSKRRQTCSESIDNESGIHGESKFCYLYIQMQLCSPFTLRDWLEDKRTVELRPGRDKLYDMFIQIVQAVDYLHSNGLMHRDLKPSNILFDKQHRMKLADFGLVTCLHEHQQQKLSKQGQKIVNQPIRIGEETSNQNVPTKKRVRNSNSECQAYPDVSWMSNNQLSLDRRHTDNVGTLLYMSPEQEHGEEYDLKVDIFSLGLIFLELMVPFSTAMERIICLTKAKKQSLPESFKKNHFDESLLTLKMLHRDASKRPIAAEILSNRIFTAYDQTTPFCQSTHGVYFRNKLDINGNLDESPPKRTRKISVRSSLTRVNSMEF